jgi:hypothetical protein
MGVLDTAFVLGDDLLGYEFQIAFGVVPYVPDLTGLLFRANTFEIPSQSRGEYEFDYKTEKIVKPNGKITTPKEFSIEFRVDKYGLVYKAFKAWMDAITNPSTGGTSMDSVGGVSLLRAPITVSTGTTNTDGIFIPTGSVFQFTGCWPKDLGSFNFDNTSGEPVMTTVRFGYLKLL